MQTPDYHADYGSVSRTMLSVFKESRSQYRLMYVDKTMSPRMPSKVMVEGLIGHACLLEDKQVYDVAIYYPTTCLKSDGSINSKPAETFRQDHPGFYYLKRDDYTRMEQMVEVLRKSDLAKAIRECRDAGGSAESRIDANLFGVACKCKPDLHGFVARDTIACYDLKFGADIRPESFARSARRFSYWLQDAHYSAVLMGHYAASRVQFRYAAIETQPPYRTHWYWYDERSREIGEEAHAALVKNLAACYDSGDFSDKWDSVLTLSQWEVNSEEDAELEGFDDEQDE